MSSHNEQVTPAPFDLVEPEPAYAPSSAPATGAPKWMIPALLGLLVMAALVVFWLPNTVDTASTTVEESSPGQTATTPTAAATKNTEPAAESSPWSDAQLARLRKDAQDVLAELLDIQFELEEAGVMQWAPDQFNEATIAATAGDELYRDRQFEAARSRYEEARDTLLALQFAQPEIFETQLQLATEGIESGDIAQVETALSLAALLDPSSIALAQLQSRAANLPALLALLEKAGEAEQSGLLSEAKTLLTEAAETDPLHQRVAVELQRITQALTRQQFNDAMSDGYAALDEGRFDTASAAFKRAATLQPGSSEAASALQETVSAKTDDKLTRLKKQGPTAEAKENWSAAVSAYEQASGIESNVSFARDGLSRAKSRARLDKQFRTAIEEPERLSDVAVAEATTKLMTQANSITPRGPVLNAQLQQLEALIQRYNTLVAVTLQSDLETEVILYKVSRLGRFEQTQLTLRPGKYTAVGTRNGYRDVRKTFTVDPNGTGAIVIACTEKI